MANLLLSDIIKLDFTLPETVVGTNVSYDITHNQTGNLIYTGSVYATGNKQTLYLNDIIYNLNDTYDWFAGYDGSTEKLSNKFIANAPLVSSLTVNFPSVLKSYFVNNIYHITRVPNSVNNYAIPTTNTIVNVNEWGTGIIPKLPRKHNGSGYPKLFGMFGAAYSENFRANNAELYLRLYDGNDIVLENLATVLYRTQGNTSFKYYIGSNLINTAQSNLTQYDKNCYVALSNGASNEIITKIFEFDEHESDYYVAWINRKGVWQCQPFCAKSQMTETVTTQTIVTVTDETIPCAKTSDFKWTVNSHWLNYAEHEEFESLLTSKYVYLYNTKTDEGHYVTVTDSNWTFKNAVNTSRPFNLTLNLTKSQKQNIIL